MDSASLDSLLRETAVPIHGFCVRVHRLTRAQAERVCKWAARLPRVDVLCDVTLPAGERALALLREEVSARALESKVRMLPFTSFAMEARYPALRHPSLEMYRAQHMWMMPALSHAWAYTAEAILVCGIGLREADAPQEEEHVWVFEHDADFAGPIEELIAAYAQDDADLIAKELVTADAFSTWMWQGCATPSFLAHYGAVRSCVHVHACRLSARLLRALHAAAAAGRIGYGEMALSTVCVGEGLRWRPLDEAHVGTPFDPQGHLDRVAFEMLEQTPTRKLYHALKW